MLTNDQRAPLILVVEDDECHTELILRAFQDAGDEYRLAVSTTLAEARLAMDHDAPALIFSDIHLPDGDGGSLILLVEDICPVIMMSALGTERLAADVIKAGAADYLVKSALSFSALPHIARRAMHAWDVRRERLHADEAARRARYEWEQTFNTIPDFIALIDSHNTIIRANRALAERCGLPASELVGKQCCDLIHGLPSPPYNCPHARMLREGREQSEVVFEPRFNGVFDVTVSPLFDSGGKLFACVHMMRDITERQQREEALLISTAKFRAVLDNAADAVFIVDPAGRCVYANQEACRLTGYRQGELLNLDLVGSVMAGQRHDILEKFRCLKPGKSVLVEAPLKHSDGDQMAVDLNLMLLPDGNIYASCRDASRGKLERLGVLAGGVAHDFNDLLVTIQGHCHGAREDLRREGAAEEQHIRSIEDAVYQASNLCRQMLAYAGRSPLVCIEVALGTLIDKTVQLLRSSLGRNVGIRLHLEYDQPPVLADYVQIQRVVLHLLINAAEAIGERDGQIGITLDRETFAAGKVRCGMLGAVLSAGDYARLEISDTGRGMDEATQQRIFEPFFSTKLPGRGLGMSAMLEIVKSHGGALRFSSELGAGTTVTIYFPLSAAVPARTGDGTAGDEAPDRVIGCTVLLVDDDEALLAVGSALLETMGVRTVTASNGREALEAVLEKGNDFDLVIMDMAMPEMNGLEAYRKLRLIDTQLPVIICSGYDDSLAGEDIADDDRASFLEKPYKPDTLRKALAGMLRGRT